MLGHTLSLDDFHGLVLRDFTSRHLHFQDTAVQVCDGAGESAESLGQRDVHGHHQICSLPLEGLVFLLLYYNYHITWDGSRNLIGFTRKTNFLAMRHAFLYIDFQYLAVFKYLASFAGLTLIFLADRLTSPFTSTACRLHLLDHTRADLTKLDPDTTTITISAGFLRAFLTTTSLAIRTWLVSRNCKSNRFAVVQVFQRSFNAMHDIFSFLWPSSPATTTSTTTKEHGKDILGRLTITATSSFKAL
mmetsp:Transcript_8954/g.14866  ORF Transcript_8954/g.14866 Transcript_8954/m.14866 type:complete len:246 (+) Transcript_8954:483-1220(+)